MRQDEWPSVAWAQEHCERFVRGESRVSEFFERLDALRAHYDGEGDDERETDLEDLVEVFYIKLDTAQSVAEFENHPSGTIESDARGLATEILTYLRSGQEAWATRVRNGDWPWAE